MDWDSLAARMDGIVDNGVGDPISYSQNGGASFTDIVGFVLTAGPREHFDPDGLDEATDQSKRVKIRKTIVPVISRDHRLKAARLGPGVWQPIGAVDDLDNDGRYWLFDVQKVC